MPPIESSKRKQDAVYWPIAGVNEHGESYVGDPVALKVRWEYRNEQVVDPKGNVIGVQAVVVVDRVIAPESKMWLGKLSDLSDDQLDETNDEINQLMEVVYYNEVPDLKGRRKRRIVGLTRYMDALPRE
jgi:hypothetical protein